MLWEPRVELRLVLKNGHMKEENMKVTKLKNSFTIQMKMEENKKHLGNQGGFKWKLRKYQLEAKEAIQG